MSLFSKKPSSDDVPSIIAAPEPVAPAAPSVDLSHFSVHKKGFDQQEVAQYVDHLLQQHRSDIEMVQRRLIEAQQQAKGEAENYQRHLDNLNQELTTVRADLEAARTFTGVDPEREVELVSARGRVAELEQEIAAATEDKSDPVEMRALQLRLEVAEKAAKDFDKQLGRLKDEANSAQESLSVSRTRVAELEAEIESNSILAAQQDKLAEDLRRAEHELSEQNKINKAMRNTLDESGVGDMADQLEKQHAESERLRAKVAELEAAGDAQKASRLRSELDALKAAHSQLEEKLEEAESGLQEGGESQAELRHTRQDLKRLEKEREELRVELREVRSRQEQALQEATRATTRVEILESELKETRERREEFGEQARRMMQALNESRDQQESEMERELGAARSEADEIRRRARKDVDDLHMKYMEDAGELEIRNQRLTDETRMRARQVTDELQIQVSDFARAAEQQVSAARDSEDQMRSAIRQAHEVDLWQKQQERELLLGEIDKLVADRDSLLVEMHQLRGEIRGEPMPAQGLPEVIQAPVDQRPPMPLNPAQPTPQYVQPAQPIQPTQPFQAVQPPPSAAVDIPGFETVNATDDMLPAYQSPAYPPQAQVDVAALAQTPAPDLQPSVMDPSTLPSSLPPQQAPVQPAPPLPPQAPGPQVYEEED